MLLPYLFTLSGKKLTSHNGFDLLPYIPSIFTVHIHLNQQRKIYILKEQFINWFAKLVKVRRKGFSRLVSHVFWSKTLNVKHTWYLTCIHLGGFLCSLHWSVLTKCFTVPEHESSFINFKTCELDTCCKQCFYKKDSLNTKKKMALAVKFLWERVHCICFWLSYK